MSLLVLMALTLGSGVVVGGSLAGCIRTQTAEVSARKESATTHKEGQAHKKRRTDSQVKPLVVGIVYSDIYLAIRDNENEDPFRYYKKAIFDAAKGSEVKFRELQQKMLWETVAPVMDEVDLLILPGGPDLDPDTYGAKRTFTEKGFMQSDKEFDEFEKKVLTKALGLKLPILGVCRGVQSINAHFGGDLYQDLEAEAKIDGRNHILRDGTRIGYQRHPMALDPSSTLFSILGRNWLRFEGAMSAHHQAIKSVGKGLRIAARHPSDGTIEAIESDHKSGMGSFIIGTQFHPERMSAEKGFEDFLKIFERLLAEAEKKRVSRSPEP